MLLLYASQEYKNSIYTYIRYYNLMQLAMTRTTLDQSYQARP